MVDHILEASDLSAFSCIILVGISQIYVEFTSDESLVHPGGLDLHEVELI